VKEKAPVVAPVGPDGERAEEPNRNFEEPYPEAFAIGLRARCGCQLS